ncbi:MAG: L17 family ribosomal protein, partial [Candidatus Acidiferrum sp.]
MRHLNSGSKLGRNPSHRRATLRNLVTNLFEHGRITTTLTRAKAARPVAEKIITLGKRDTLQSRRQAA